MDLLPPQDRNRVVGLIVNRFMGDPDLFEDGIRQMEELCDVPVLALVPHLDHGLDEEDRPFRIPIDERTQEGLMNVGAVLSPRVSNTEDLAPLLAETDVHLTWITNPKLALEQDLLILPGTKATVGDLAAHAASGMAQALREARGRGAWILGLCGGYQMLGQHLVDAEGSEVGPQTWPGLGFLPISTTFHSEKQTTLSTFISRWPEGGHALEGYEIHHGRTKALGGGEPLVEDAGAEAGWREGRALGSYLHGLLKNDAWRSALLNQVRQDRGLPEQPARRSDPLDDRIQRWADHFRRNLRPGVWERILGAVRN
jgi:adenosylcobyric acid synthase